LEAFLAGNDIILCPNNVPAAVELIEKAILESPALKQELNKRVLKILQFKERMGLHEKKRVSKEAAHLVMRDQEALDLKKELYSKAVTLLKNDQNLLPIRYDETQNIAVVTVQLKTSSDAEPFVQQLANDLPGSKQFFVDKHTPRNECEYIARSLVDNKYDVVIIGVFDLLQHLGERGHRARELVDFVYWLKSHGKKTVIAFFDSPYVVGILPTPDALILAYENDSDAQQAAADVITGKLKPMGKLPVTISEQFKRGCGLTF
jgi:beta-glucosidase-like glycosyl hydrolase